MVHSWQENQSYKIVSYKKKSYKYLICVCFILSSFLLILNKYESNVYKARSEG